MDGHKVLQRRRLKAKSTNISFSPFLFGLNYVKGLDNDRAVNIGEMGILSLNWGQTVPLALP